MAYQITKTTSNGYRCGCCQRDWTDSEWVDTLEEALEKVPIALVDGEPHQFNGDLEVTRVEVVDGSTGEQVAWASTTWSVGYGRYSGYDYTRWAGFRPDSGSFEVVYSGRNLIDKTWDEVTDELKGKHHEAERKKAERDLEDAQKRLKHYSP